MQQVAKVIPALFDLVSFTDNFLYTSTGSNAFRIMTKKEFLKYIEDIKTDKVLIIDSVDRLDEEVETNCWAISINDKLSKRFSIDELSSFLNEVKTDRREQLRRSKINVGLIYYVWVDGQAGQLRFNFINSNHDKLPFRSQLTLVTMENEILTDYLTRPHTYHGTTKVFKELIAV